MTEFRVAMHDGRTWRTPFLVLLGIVVSLVGSHAFAIDTIVAEEYCQKPGLALPPRQTVIVLDEGMVVKNPDGGIAPENQKWLRDINRLFDIGEAGRVETFLPRERVSVYLAPRSGSQPKLLLTGCIPRYSTEELAAAEAGQGSTSKFVDYLFESGIADEAREYSKQYFQKRLTLALGQLAPEEYEELPDLGVIRSLSRDRQLINPKYGIPRVIIVGNLDANVEVPSGSAKEARAWGFTQAKEVGLKLQRAEIYVIGKSSSMGREALRALFLGSEGDLAGWSEEMLGVFGPNPSSVEVFRGTVRYCENKFPMELRVSVDTSGQLRNSWIAVSVQDRVSTPIEGAFVCTGKQECKLTSRDGGLGQVWTAKGEGAGPAEFSSSLPLSGFRRLEATIEGDSVHGRIWDPVGKLDCPETGEREFGFELVRDTGVPF